MPPPLFSISEVVTFVIRQINMFPSTTADFLTCRLVSSPTCLLTIYLKPSTSFSTNPSTLRFGQISVGKWIWCLLDLTHYMEIKIYCCLVQIVQQYDHWNCELNCFVLSSKSSFLYFDASGSFSKEHNPMHGFGRCWPSLPLNLSRISKALFCRAVRFNTGTEALHPVVFILKQPQMWNLPPCRLSTNSVAIGFKV